MGDNMTHPDIRYTEATGDTSLFHEADEPDEVQEYSVPVWVTCVVNVSLRAASQEDAEEQVRKLSYEQIRNHMTDGFEITETLVWHHTATEV